MSDDQAAALRARVARERDAWDSAGVDQSFKDRFPAVFANRHLAQCEAHFDAAIARHARDADVLDYGCFDGQSSAALLAHAPRSVTGIDVAERAIASARARYPDARLAFAVGDAHRLPLRAQSFDLVVGRAILHHLELDVALREIARVLRPGGHAMFVEPLGLNPGARLVAWLTPHARTPDEHPLLPRDIRAGETILGPGEHRYTGFFTAPIGMAGALFKLNGDSLVMRLAGAGDTLAEQTPLRFLGRQAYLSFTRT